MKRFPPCQTSEYQRQGPMPDLVEVSLHEIAHYVSFRLGLDPLAYGRLKQRADAYNRDPSTPPGTPGAGGPITTSMRTSPTPAPCLLHIYSNYRDAAANDAEAQAKADMRVAEYLDWEHDTSGAIAAARKAFRRNPTYGLGVIETTRWAARLVASMPLERLSTLASARAAPEIGDPLLADAAFKARLRDAHDQVIAARNRFCGLG